MSKRKCPFCGHHLGRFPYWRFFKAILGYDWCPGCGFKFWGFYVGIPEDELSLREFMKAMMIYVGTNPTNLKSILKTAEEEEKATKKARKP